jgi:hypothetical protein
LTTRADIPRLAASLAVLGTTLEHHGQTAWDVTAGWQHGPRKAPSRGERGGGTGDSNAPDRAAEAKMRARAAEHHRELRQDLATLDALVQSVLRRIDIACPPNPEEVKNRATGDLEPWTEAEIVVAGWCATCWRACQAWSPIPTDRNGIRRWKDRCGWCGPFRAAHGIDPPKELVVKHHEGRNLSAQEVDDAVRRAKAEATPRRKGKRRKTKAAA